MATQPFILRRALRGHGSLGHTLCGSTSTTADSPALRMAGAAAAAGAPPASRAREATLSSPRAVPGGGCATRQGRRAEQLHPGNPGLQLLERPQDMLERRPAHDDPHEMLERRVAELAAALELLGEEPLDVVPGGVGDRPRVRLERLHQHLSRRIATAAPGELGDQLEGPLLRAKIGQAEPGVGVDDGGELDPREVMPLGHHLRPEQNGAGRLGEAPQELGERLGPGTTSPSSRINSSSGSSRASSRSSFCVPAPSRARSGDSQTGQAVGAPSTKPQ